MGFKSRDKKRRARLAQSSSRREQRSKYADRHYLTIVSPPAVATTAASVFAKATSACSGSSPRRSSASTGHGARDQVQAVAALGEDKRPTALFLEVGRRGGDRRLLAHPWRVEGER